MKYKILLILTFCIFSFNLTSLHAQELGTKSAKAKKYYEEASQAFAKRDTKEGINLLVKAIEKDPNFADAHYKLGIIYQQYGYFDEMVHHLTKSITLAPENPQFLGAYYHLSKAYFDKGKYEDAKKLSQKFLTLNPKNKQYISDANRIIVSVDFAIEGMKHPLDFTPKALNANVNKPDYLQYFPVLTGDEQLMVFTARLKGRGTEESIFTSQKNAQGLWNDPVPISDKINTPYNEGTCSISADGSLIVFTSCEGRKSYGSCDLFMAKKYGNEWTEPINLGANVNSPAWESQPALSADGKTLFFSSTRGGQGKRDIWISKMDEKGQWGPPKNLGAEINTPNDDLSPFLHVNGKTLFFASNGHIGYGGFDLYYTNYINGQWTKPENLGYPINSFDDQVSLFITTDGKKGYYSKEERKGSDYISSILTEFDMPPIAIQQKSNYVRGTIYDAKTKEKLSANVDLFDLNVDDNVSSVVSDSKTGNYLIVITEGTEYALQVTKQGYAFKSLTFNYIDKKDLKPLEIDIYLDPIAAGVKFTLNNLFFATGEYKLEDKSKTELNELIKFMKNNPQVKGEISGHTDDVGEDKANKELSLKRAKSVYDYLTQNGMEASRLKYQGYGETQPAAPNDSDANRQLNRRIEFKIF